MIYIDMMNSENVSLMTNFNIIVILINCLLGIEELIKTGITDLVVALGLNHAKMGWSETDNAVDRLVKYYRLIKRGIPALRLYYVEVPPSLSRITSLRALMMNRWMAGPCSELGMDAFKPGWWFCPTFPTLYFWALRLKSVTFQERLKLLTKTRPFD